MNFLALNLADDIVKGKRSVEDARQFYAKTAMEAMKGQMSLYTQKLQFSPAQRTADELLRPRPRRMRNAVRHRASNRLRHPRTPRPLGCTGIFQESRLHLRRQSIPMHVV